jgi:hypothetical protein
MPTKTQKCVIWNATKESQGLDSKIAMPGGTAIAYFFALLYSTFGLVLQHSTGKQNDSPSRYGVLGSRFS